MATTKQKNDTFKPEEAPYSVHLDSGEIVTVMATSSEEAVQKAKQVKEEE